MNALPVSIGAGSPDVHLVIDERLIRKYGGNGPRYTSYPTADRFVEAFDAAAYRHWLSNRNIGAFARPLGLYVHVPFCDTICLYCACNKITTRDRGRAPQVRGIPASARWRSWPTRSASDRADRADALGRRHADLPRRRGHGVASCRRCARRSSSTHGPSLRSRSIRARPTPRASRCLRALGFNRMSIGVQDFDGEVQRAVNRVQSLRGDARGDRRGSRARLRFDQHGPDLRPAEAEPWPGSRRRSTA